MRQLIEALKPFAEIAQKIDGGFDEFGMTAPIGDNREMLILLGDCRTARAALEAYRVPVDVDEIVGELSAGEWHQTGINAIDGKPFTTDCTRVARYAAALIERLVAENREAMGKALEGAMNAAYSVPAYCEGVGPGPDGLLKPGSPYDRGRYDAREAIRAMKETGT